MRLGNIFLLINIYHLDIIFIRKAENVRTQSPVSVIIVSWQKHIEFRVNIEWNTFQPNNESEEEDRKSLLRRMIRE